MPCVPCLRLCVSIRRALIYVVGTVEGRTVVPVALIFGEGQEEASCERVRLACMCARAFSLSLPLSLTRASDLGSLSSQILISCARGTVALLFVSLSLSLSLSLVCPLVRSFARPPVGWRVRARINGICDRARRDHRLMFKWTHRPLSPKCRGMTS